MFINWRTRELMLNVVYYGPALSGKTTNLEQIHARLAANARSELFVLNTHEDRTIFFDFMQLELAPIAGLKPRFGLYTVPGQVYYAATRETVLRRADGVVFVVDSQAERLEENRASWLDLEQQLQRMGYTWRSMPLVLQFNKRDLPSALPVDTLREELGLPAALPGVEAIALQGVGVQQTLKLCMGLMLSAVRRQLEAGEGGDKGEGHPTGD